MVEAVIITPCIDEEDSTLHHPGISDNAPGEASTPRNTLTPGILRIMAVVVEPTGASKIATWQGLAENGKTYESLSQHPSNNRQRKIARKIFDEKLHKDIAGVNQRSLENSVYKINPKTGLSNLRDDPGFSSLDRKTKKSIRRDEKLHARYGEHGRKPAYQARMDLSDKLVEKSVIVENRIVQRRATQSPRVVRNNSYHGQRRDALLNYANDGLLDFSDALDIDGTSGPLEKSMARIRNVKATRDKNRMLKDRMQGREGAKWAKRKAARHGRKVSK